MRCIKSDDVSFFLNSVLAQWLLMAFDICLGLPRWLHTDKRIHIQILISTGYSLTTNFKRKKSYVSPKKFFGPYFIAPWFLSLMHKLPLTWRSIMAA